MSAGESAFDVARRQREKAARLERSAELWEKGAHGEVEVARVLATLPRDWVVVHDIAWPGRPRANIDHVAIGPAGVFVIDAKNWSGRIEVRDQVLVLNGRSRPEAVASAAQAAVALRAFIAMPVPCMSVLCFVRDDDMTGWAGDVMACTTANLADMLTTRPLVMSPDQVQECAELVRRTDRRRTPSSSPGGPSGPATEVEAPTRRRRNRTSRHLVSTLVVGVLFLALLAGGGLTKLSDWAGVQLVEQVTSDRVVPSEQLKDGKKARTNRRTNEKAKRSRS